MLKAGISLRHEAHPKGCRATLRPRYDTGFIEHLLLFLSKEIRVRACSDKMKFVAPNTVYKEPVGFNMAFSAVFQFTLKLMVFVICGESNSLDKFTDDSLKVVGIFLSFLSFLNIPFELARAEYHIHSLIALHSEIFKKVVDILELLAHALA